MRARSKPGAEACPAKAERIKIFFGLMRDQLYVRHVTLAEYAAKWGLSERTLEDDAAAAARMFELSDEEKAVAKSVWLEQLRNSAAKANKLERFEAEARFFELQAKAQGFLEPQKIELSGSLGDLLSLATGSGGEDPDPAVGE